NKAPSGQSQYGFYSDRGIRYSTSSNLKISGGFSKGAFFVGDSQIGMTYSTLFASQVSNSIPAAEVWHLPSSLPGVVQSSDRVPNLPAVDDVTAYNLVGSVQPTKTQNSMFIDVTLHGVVGDG